MRRINVYNRRGRVIGTISFLSYHCLMDMIAECIPGTVYEGYNELSMSLKTLKEIKFFIENRKYLKNIFEVKIY